MPTSTIGALLVCLAISQETTPPEPQRGLRVREPEAFDGYTLFSPLLSGTTFLIDMQGEVVHRWETGLPVGSMAELTRDGRLLRTVRVEDNPRFAGGGIGGRLVEYDWEGKVTWEYALADEQRILHHEFEILPNGNVLAICWEHVSKADAVALGRDAKATDPDGWWPDAVIELQPTRPVGAKIVWEWRARDHLIQDSDPNKPGYGSIPDHPELFDINADHRDEPPLTPAQRKEREDRERQMRGLGYTGGDDDDEERDTDPDWMHTNAVAYHAAHDLIVLSSPRLNEIWVIDHGTTTEQARGHAGGRRGRGGDILYRWGNPKNYGAGEKREQRLFGQHDPQWLPGDRMALTLFNNGLERPDGKWSSVDELVLPFDDRRGFTREPGKAFEPREPAWTYVAPERESLYSFFISGAQRLPNGNTLICSGAQGRFLEVTREGKIAWEFWNPHGGEIPHSFGKASDRPSRVDPKAVFRCLRMAKDHPALSGRLSEPASR